MYAAVGIMGNFFALYLKSINVSGSEIGIVLGVLPITGLLFGPIWAYFADSTQNLRAVLVIACLGLIISILVATQSREFWGLLSCMLVYAVFHPPILPICNSLALHYLANKQDQQGFGNIRMWGSIGFAVSVFLVGALVIEVWPSGILYLYVAITISCAVFVLTIPESRLPPITRGLKSINILRSNPKLLELLSGITIIGVTLGIANQYMILYLDDLATAGWLSGFILAAGALCEVPLMAYTKVLVQHFGLRLMLLIGVGLLPIRWCLYIFIKNPILLLPLQLIHSIAMLSLLVVGVVLVDNLLPPQWRTTGQTMYAVALHNLGGGIGVFAAGFIYDYYNMSTVWAVCLVTGVIGFLVLLYATREVRSPNSHTELC